jgi:flagellar assembly protein FliH
MCPPPVLEPDPIEDAPVPRYSPVPEDLGPSADALALQEELCRQQAELDALRAERASLAEALAAREPSREALRAEVLREAEPELVRLALAIAGRVVGRELRTDPALVVRWAREAVDALPARGTVTVALSPDLASGVPEGAWREALGDDHAVVLDPTRPSGTCEVRSGASTVESGPAARFDALREELGE